MDRKLVGLVSLFFIAFFVFLAVVFFSKSLTQLTRAKEDTLPSGSNSLIFAWPLSAKANSQSEINVNVFVRSGTNKFIPNKAVTLNTTLGKIRISSEISDKNGKASFVLTSDRPGKADLTATIDNSIPILKQLTIEFN